MTRNYFSHTYSADPFEHWVIDGFLPEEMARATADNFYRGEGQWIRRHHLYCKNKQTRVSGLSVQTEAALVALECEGMRTYLEVLTGVTGLQNDVMRFGGGQHVTTRGGRLGIHADFTHHPTTMMRRALNLLLYLNDVGQEGALQLWSKDMSWCQQLVPAKFNRAVIFKPSTTSYHGHPDPLQEDERLSLAVYYYVQPLVSQVIKVTGRSATEYATIGAPEEILMEPRLKTTDYRPRPWEYKLRLRKWLSKKVKG